MTPGPGSLKAANSSHRSMMRLPVPASAEMTSPGGFHSVVRCSIRCTIAGSRRGTEHDINSLDMHSCHFYELKSTNLIGSTANFGLVC